MGLKECYEQALQRDDVKAIVVTGAKGKFSGGFDITAFGGMQGGKTARKPSVAAIDGLALGGGLEVAMACHARISTPSAQLGLPELRLGIFWKAKRPWVKSLYKTDKIEPLGEAREILKFARTQARKQAPNLEHPIVCINVIEEGIVSGPRAGLWKEVEAFQGLLHSDTCKSLFHIFFAQRGTSRIFWKAKRPWVKSLYKTDKIEPLGEAREILKFARTQARKQAPNLEHPIVCINVIEEGIVSGPRAGLWKEVEAFQGLLHSDTCKSLFHIFFAQRGTSRPISSGLCDLVGFGVAIATGTQFVENFPERTYKSMLIPIMQEDKRAGEATRKGFYVYNDKRKASPDPEIKKKLFRKQGRFPALMLILSYPTRTLWKMVFFPVVNKACRVLAEGIAVKASDLDIAAVMGMGFFPPYRGGIMFWADSLGSKYICSKLEEWSNVYDGGFFKPCAYLAERATKGALLSTLVERAKSRLLQGLKECYELALQRDDVKAIVVTGAKGKFSGGFDITAFGGMQGRKMAPPKPGFISVKVLTDTVEAARKPSVAAIDGLALGGGLEVAMACHARISTLSAQLGLPELQLGVIPGFGGTQRLPRLVGLSEALEMMLTSKLIKGEEAHDLGLVDAIVSPDELINTARQWALDILEAKRPWVKSLYKTDKIEPLGEAREILKFARTQEVEAFQGLLHSDTCKSLIHIFFAQRGTSRK
ncbi:unnamed protein product [Camellia sinensis]